MTSPSEPEASHPLLTGSALVVSAAKLLRTHFDQLSSQDREDILDLLARRAEDLGAGVKDMVQRGEGLLERSDVQTERIEALEAAALDSEAAALVSDARIRELAAEIERLHATRDQAAVVEEAKGVLMSLMDISEDAAFAVLVAASQRDDVSLATVAHRLATSHDEFSRHRS
jgi:hypothetical protein